MQQHHLLVPLYEQGHHQHCGDDACAPSRRGRNPRTLLFWPLHLGARALCGADYGKKMCENSAMSGEEALTGRGRGGVDAPAADDARMWPTPTGPHLNQDEKEVDEHGDEHQERQRAKCVQSRVLCGYVACTPCVRGLARVAL